MAYDKEEIYKEALKRIEDHKLFFIEDIVAYLPCTKSTFYGFFPIDSDEMNYIKGKIDEQKIAVKVSIRAKLLKGKGTELIALYKLIGTNEERQRLSQTHVDHTSDGEKLQTNVINLGVGIDPEKENK